MNPCQDCGRVHSSMPSAVVCDIAYRGEDWTRRNLAFMGLTVDQIDALVQTVTETDEERDARFAPGNDTTWGAGNWVRCETCPPDDEGWAVYHHKDAHS